MNKTAKNSFVYLSGTILMGLLGFINTLLLTRVLSQQVYAMYGLLVTFISAVDVLLAFGYDQAYVRFFYTHRYSVIGYLWKCIKFPLMLFTLFLVLVLEPGGYLLRCVFEETLSVMAIILLLCHVFFSNIHRFTQLTARMGEFAGNYVLSGIVAKSGFVVLIGLVFLMVGSVTFEWVVASFVVASAAAVFVNLAAFRKMPKEINLQGKQISNMEMLQYGVPCMINNALVLLIPVWEKIIIRDLAGWEVLSIFTAASVFQTIVLVLVNTLQNIWNPIVYKHCDNAATFKPLLHTFGMIGTVVLSLGTAACILLRRWLVLLLDEKYFSVYVIAPAILLAACYGLISLIYSVGINIRKKTLHLIITPIIQLGLSVVLCYLLIPSMGLIGVGLSVLCSVCVSHIYRIAVGLKLYNTGTPEVKSLLICLLSTAAAVCALFFTEFRHDIISALALVSLTVVILNKDIISIIKVGLELITSKRESEKMD